MYLWVNIIVCQVVYFILIIVARCLRKNRDKTRQSKLDNNTMAEKCFILTGLQGQTVNHDDIQTKINAGFQNREIEVRVKSLHLGFTGGEVGLDSFQSEGLLGFVRLTGDNVKKVANINIGDTLKLHVLPEDILGRTEAKLQQHLADVIPDFKEKIVILCKKLGIEISLDQRNIYLVGDSLQINIARSHLNQLFAHTANDFIVCGGDTSKNHNTKKLNQMISQYKVADTDRFLKNQSTAYLQLAYYLERLPSNPGETVVSIIPRPNCYNADVVFQHRSSRLPSWFSTSFETYKNTLETSLKNLQTKYKPVYLCKQMPLDYRRILETALEQYKPTLYMKCKKRHWSCYIFPTDKATEVQKFVDDYLRVNTYKPLADWWFELPKEILTTSEPRCTNSATKRPSTESEAHIEGDTSNGMGTTEPEKKEITSKLDDANRNKPPVIATKPKTTCNPSEIRKRCPLPVKQQNIQYLYVNQMKEIQELEDKHKVRLGVDGEGMFLMASTDKGATEMEEELKQKSANLHCVTVQDVFASESTVRGTLILNCIEDTSVSVRGPKELVEAFQKAMAEKNKNVDTNDLQMQIDRVKQPGKKLNPDDPENAEREASATSRRRHSPEGDEHKGSMIDNKTTLQSDIKGIGSEDEHGSSKRRAEAPASPTEEEIPPLMGPGKEAPKPVKRVRGLKDTKATAKSVDSNPPSKSTPQIKVTGTESMKTYKSETTGILVKVGKGDITKLQVDAIVNAANDELDHIGGVARAIADAAGPGFDEECKEALQRRRKKLKTGDICVTGAGDMPAKNVLHAVGPAIDDYKYESDAFDALKKTFDNCLREAQNEMCEHVAIPAISSGNFGIPVDKVAKMAAKALTDFLNSNNTDPLCMVIFIDIQQEMIRLLDKEMKKLVKNGVLKDYGGSVSTAV